MQAKPPGMRWIVVGAGLVGMAVGGGHVLAWMTGLMTRVAVSTIIMKANAGLGLSVSGLVLVLLSPPRPSRARGRLALALAGFVFVLALATLAEHAFGWSLHIDQMLATERAGAAATMSPNRMGPPAAVSLLLLALGLMLLSRDATPRRRVLRETFALVVALLGLLAVIGHLYHASELYQVARLTAIAWPTALSLLALAVGLLCARPDTGLIAIVMAQDPGGAIIRALLGPIVVLPVVFGWVRLEGERRAWFDAPTGTGLMMMLFIVTFSALLLFAGRRVSLASEALGTSEEALRQSEAFLSFALATAHIGAWDLDLVDHTARRSPDHDRIFGYDTMLPEWTYEAFLAHVIPEDREAVDRKFRAAVAERRDWTFECRILRRDGEQRWIWAAGRHRLDDRGRPQRIVGVVQDTTERRRADEALRASYAVLAEADRRKDEFIAILSHELRNPLAPIRYALPPLHAQRLDEAGDRALAVIDRQVDHLARLVDDLLDVSRITGGKIELRPEYVTLASVLTVGAEAASPAIVAARHKLNIVVPDEPIWLHADPPRISQIVTNLLNNSAKYTPRGGEILLEAAQDGDWAIIRVRDNGIGIPVEALPTVFDMFRQVDRPDKSQGGLGIGLALVKRLVEMHGGTIEVRSEGIDRGAEFVVRLPIAPEGVSAEPAGVPAAARATVRPLRVLIVDDNADLVEMVAMVVEGAGHEARKALDGRSAISAALSYRPHVVLLDLGLPAMSGIEVARELRRHREMAGVRLVAVTGWGQAEDRRQTQEAGFDHHLTKPTEPQALQRLLADIAVEVRERSSGK